MQPLVSVIIATYNGKEKRFSQTIESVLNQSYKNLELIIVNDASTNNIEETILRYYKKYDNIVYLKNEKNSERSYSRNRGIFESKGKYIAFLDDDDIWIDKDKIKKQVQFLEKNKDYVMCGTSLIFIDENNNQINKCVATVGDDNLKSSLLKLNGFFLSSVVIRKDILLYSGLFDGDYNKVEDYDLWLRIGRYGKVENIANSFIYYRVWQGNTSTTSSSEQRKLSFKSMWNNKKYYPNFCVALLSRSFMEFIIPNCLNILPSRVIEFLKNLKKTLKI